MVFLPALTLNCNSFAHTLHLRPCSLLKTDLNSRLKVNCSYSACHSCCPALQCSYPLQEMKIVIIESVGEYQIVRSYVRRSVLYLNTTQRRTVRQAVLPCERCISDRAGLISFIHRFYGLLLRTCSKAYRSRKTPIYGVGREGLFRCREHPFKIVPARYTRNYLLPPPPKMANTPCT